MAHEYDGIETHSDNAFGERHAAINVKVHARINIPDECAEYADAAWESVREQWWDDALECARESGYDYIFSEGRSDGWLIPFYQPTARAQRLYSWPGQGGNLGYPRYPDMDQIGERARFRAFQRKIERMIEGVPERVRDEARAMYEDRVAAGV